MKHVTNEGGGHVWSFLGTFMTYLSSSNAEVFMVWLCALINPLFNTVRSFWVTLEEDMMRGRTILTLLFPAHSLPTYSFCVWHEIACLNICSWGSCINCIFADGAISPSDDSIIWGGKGGKAWLHYSKEVVYDVDYVAFIYYFLCTYNPHSGDTDTFSWQPLVLGWWLCHRSLAAGVSRESSRTSTTQCSRASSGQKRWYLLSDQIITW